MLTCQMCNHTGLDVHEYKYMGVPRLLPECDDLSKCFERQGNKVKVEALCARIIPDVTLKSLEPKIKERN